MTQVTFSCPKCGQSLEGEESLRGRIIACPACGAQLTVPAQTKMTLPPKDGGGAPFPRRPTKKRFGVSALLVALAVGFVGGLGLGSLGGGAGGSVAPRLGIGRLTKDQWKQKMRQHSEVVGNQIAADVKAEDFKRVMGAPDRTQTVGEHTYWYYGCRDGQIQIVIKSSLLDPHGLLYGARINDY
jgi:DNA-directed RNA polymerase subunit RPC12/RpoP